MASPHFGAWKSWRCVQETDGRSGLRNRSVLRIERRLRVYQHGVQNRYPVTGFRFESWNTKRHVDAPYWESCKACARIAYGQWTVFPLLYGRFSPDNRFVSFTARIGPNRSRIEIAPVDVAPAPERGWIQISEE